MMDALCESFAGLTAVQKSAVSVVVLMLTSYTCLFVHRYYRIWRTLKDMPGPFQKGWIGYIPPAYNIFCLVLQHAYAEFLETSTGVFQLLNGLCAWFERDRIFKVYLGFQPAVIVYKPEAVEAVLNHSTNLKKPMLYRLLNSWLGTGLLTSWGSKWRCRRKMLTPAFHFRILEDFLPVMNEQAEVFAHCLDAKVGTNFDIVPAVTRCTLDVICETAMGVKVGAQTGTKSGYVRDVYAVGRFFLERIVRPWLYPDVFYLMTQEGRTFDQHVKGIHAFTNGVIKERKAKKLIDQNSGAPDVKKRLAFLDLLLDEHLKNPLLLPEEDIREEVDTFMFEGHDTTAMALSWTIFLLGHHPEVQRRCQEELDRIFGDASDGPSGSHDDSNRPATVDDLREMKYLECCIKEALRLYPSVPIIGREVHTSFEVNEHRIPAGSVVLVFSYALHRDRETFPRPEEFLPERFLPENVVGRHPFAYVPFSAGPRNCIGQRFALMEEKVILSRLLRNFSIRSLCGFDRLEITAEMVIRSRNGLPVTIMRRPRPSQAHARGAPAFIGDNDIRIGHKNDDGRHAGNEDARKMA